MTSIAPSLINSSTTAIGQQPIGRPGRPQSIALPATCAPTRSRGHDPRYTAVVDREAIGCGYEPIVWVTLKEVTRESMSAFESAIQPIAEVVEVLRMMGQPTTCCASPPQPGDVRAALHRPLARLPHVQTLTSQVAMKSVKRTTRLPIHV
jgi:hypothetical protein